MTRRRSGSRFSGHDKPCTRAPHRPQRAPAPLSGGRPSSQMLPMLSSAIRLSLSELADVPEQPRLLGKRRLGVAGPPRKLQADIREPGRRRGGDLFKRSRTGQGQPAKRQPPGLRSATPSIPALRSSGQVTEAAADFFDRILRSGGILGESRFLDHLPHHRRGRTLLAGQTDE